MTVVLGDRRSFAVEIGERDHELRRVDLWAAGEWLTCDDNMSYVMQFQLAVRDAITLLRSGQGSPRLVDGLAPGAAHRRLMLRARADDESEAEYAFRRRFRFMDWGPTTDNVAAHHFGDGDRSVLTVEFRRAEHLVRHPEHEGAVFVAELPTAEFVGILESLVGVLDRGRDPGRA